MALTVLQTPDVLSLSRNPVEFKIETDNRITTPGVKASLIIVFQAVAVADESFMINWLDNSVTLTFKAVPDGSGNQLSDNSTVGSLDDFMARLLTEIKQNYDLHRDFAITLDEVTIGPSTYPTIVLTAREAGTDYTMSFSESASNIVSGVNTAGVNEVVRENFKVLFEVYIYDADGNPEMVYDELQEPDENEQCLFDISGVLDPYVHHDFPDLSLNDFEVCTGAKRKYFVRYGESYGATADIQKMVSSSDYHVLVGGIKKQNFPDTSFFSDIVSTSLKLLTWQPLNKTITKSQKEYLYYFNHPDTSPTSLILAVYLTFTNGSNLLISAKTIAATKYSMYKVPTGYDQLGLSAFMVGAHAGKTVKSYQAWIVGVYGILTTPLSETITYTIETECKLPEHYFLFGNSAGGVDTLRTYGDHITTFETDYELSGKTLPSGYSSTDREVIKTGISSEDTFEVSTGFLYSKEQKEYLKELLLSEEAFEIIDNEKVPITILTKKDELFKQSDNLYALRFEYAIAIKNNSYSNI
jgi:hypothetical protein